MKRALLFRFVWVLLLALFISSIISYYFIGKQLLSNNIANLSNTISVIDYALDYEEDVQEQVDLLHKTIMDDNLRITIIETNGVVVADSQVQQTGVMENHLDREEIQMTRDEGTGYATRYSDTLKKNMLYVAAISDNGDYFIRISMEYTSILDYMKIIFPILLAGIGIALLISIVIAVRFTNTITRPLMEISEEMEKINPDHGAFHFKQYQYEELSIISDTTNKLSDEIQEYLQKLEFEKKVRQEFFSNASHELKTPITSIKGYAELMDQGFVKEEAVQKDFVTRILKETDNMTNLINDILMISRLETNEAEVTFSMVRMYPLMKEVFDSLEPIAADYQVTLHGECEPVTIEASAKQLRELIMNLTSNAIMYNRPDGNVWVKILKVNSDLVIKISDDGMGISPEDQKRVFERFYRVDKGRSKKMGGTGLGLSIVKHIVEFYQGSIQLESRPGEGSTFTITIPFIRESDES